MFFKGNVQMDRSLLHYYIHKRYKSLKKVKISIFCLANKQ